MHLLRMPELPRDERADALAAWSRRVPIEQPEHWLARTLEHHVRGDRRAAEHAAEMAWLSGAGEIAVLLDAGLVLLADGGAMRRRDATPGSARVWRRVAAADPADCPASTLLLLVGSVAGTVPIDFEPKTAANLPLAVRDAAAPWFVAAAGHDPELATRWLRVAIALGAAPDYAARPWSLVGTTERDLLDAEAGRGR
jgi:hypothetical protein